VIDDPPSPLFGKKLSLSRLPGQSDKSWEATKFAFRDLQLSGTILVENDSNETSLVSLVEQAFKLPNDS
jgi:hypothetical protein